MLRTKSTLKLGSLVLGTAVVFGACGDDNGTGPTGTLTQQDKTAIQQAITTSGALGSLSAFAGLLFLGLDEFGTMSAASSAAAAAAIEEGVGVALSSVAASSYDGVGVQILFDIDAFGEVTQGWFAGAFGWAGLSGGTVVEVVAAGAIGLTGSPSSSGTFTVFDTASDDGGGFAQYYSRDNGAFIGTSGTVTLSGANFGGGGTDCSGGQQGITCSYVTGTMSGGFNFEATAVPPNTGTYSQSQVNYSGLPAIQVTISATLAN